MLVRFLFVSVVVSLLAPHAWTQRSSAPRGSVPAPTSHTPVPDIGTRYGVGPSGLPTVSAEFGGHRAEDEPKVEFSSQTVLVAVPVVVTDKSGQHVHSLSKDKFHIFENGKEQKVSTFEEVSATSAPLLASATKPGEFQNVSAELQQPPRTLAIFAIDSINAPFLDQSVGRRELIRYLSANLDPAQVTGLVLIGAKGMRVLQGLTPDPAALVAAVKKVSGELPAMQGYDDETQVAAASLGSPSTPSQGTTTRGGFAGDSGAPSMVDTASELRDFVRYGDAVGAAFQQELAIETTLRAFLDVAAYVCGIPGKKALIWATGGFPFTLDSPSSVPGGRLSLLYERTMSALNQAQLSVYPVDVRGLVSNSPVADPKYNGGHLGPQMMNAAVGRSWLQASTLETLMDIAAMTGGRAFYNTNDLAGSFRKATDDASSYYALGYYLNTHNDKPGWRGLKVKVNQPGLEVRARSGFFVTNATMNLAVSRSLDEEAALSSPFDATSIPVTLRWLGTSRDGEKRKVNFSIALPRDTVVIEESMQNHFSFDLRALAKDENGKTVGKFDQSLQGNIKPEAMQIIKAQGISYHNLIELAPGRYKVKIVLRDNLTGKIGSVSAPLTVD